MTDAGQDSRTSDGTRGAYANRSLISPHRPRAKFAHIVGRRGRRCAQDRLGGASQEGGRLAMKHTTSPPLSENATSAPTFADVARFIAGPDAPTWLVEHFARWSPSLMMDRSVEKMQPTRVAMKERLDEVRDAASMLQHALLHTPTREFLEIAPSGPIECRVAFEHMLQDLVAQVCRGPNRVWLRADALVELVRMIFISVFTSFLTGFIANRPRKLKFRLNRAA
jgi:hypothetical protein